MEACGHPACAFLSRPQNIQALREWGLRAEQFIADRLEAVGATVFRQVSVETPWGLRVYDVVYKIEGGFHALDVKLGSALRTGMQQAKDAWILMNKPGAIGRFEQVIDSIRTTGEINVPWELLLK